MDALTARTRIRRGSGSLAVLWVSVAVAVLMSACKGAGKPRAILLVSLDTTRPDHLSAYGYGKATTPTLRRLASQGVRFESAHASMPTTDPSHTTMLTGLYPSAHGVRRNGGVLTDPTIETLASWLGRRGYATGAVTARVHLDPSAIGLAGFDFSDPPQPPALTRTAGEVLARVREHLTEMSGKDWFLWVHLWEPHAPYDPPAEERRRFYSGRLDRSGKPPRVWREPPMWVGDLNVGATPIRHIGELYDGEIATADAALESLVRLAVDHTPGHSQPLVIVVSDHGEELGERQRATGIGFGHGTLLYEEVVRVAWVLWRPGVIPVAVLHTPVSLVDLAATVSSFVDAGSPLLGEGRSLASAVLGGREPAMRPLMIERRSFSSASGVRSRLRARQWARLEGNWKLVYTEGAETADVGCGEGAQLYDLSADPGERSDRRTVEARRCARMIGDLRAWIGRGRALGPGPAAPRIDGRKLENLHSLGYID